MAGWKTLEPLHRLQKLNRVEFKFLAPSKKKLKDNIEMMDMLIN